MSTDPPRDATGGAAASLRRHEGSDPLRCAECGVTIWMFGSYALLGGDVVICDWCVLGVEVEPCSLPS